MLAFSAMLNRARAAYASKSKGAVKSNASEPSTEAGAPKEKRATKSSSRNAESHHAQRSSRKTMRGKFLLSYQIQNNFHPMLQSHFLILSYTVFHLIHISWCK